MKRFGVVVALMALLALPIAGAAQYYPDEEPTGGGGAPSGGMEVGGGDINVGGGQGGTIQVGGGQVGDIQVGGGMPQIGAADVTIVDFAFDPLTVFVSAGDTVDWYNAGAAPHTVTSNTGLFDSGTINPGGRYSYTFDEAGAYPYYCDFHPQMIGVVVVS